MQQGLVNILVAANKRLPCTRTHAQVRNKQTLLNEMVDTLGKWLDRNYAHSELTHWVAGVHQSPGDKTAVQFLSPVSGNAAGRQQSGPNSLDLLHGEEVIQ